MYLSIAIALAFFSIVYRLDRKRYTVVIQVIGKYVKSYNSNILPVRDNTIYLTTKISNGWFKRPQYVKNAYYVKHVVIINHRGDETLYVECEDISNVLNKNLS